MLSEALLRNYIKSILAEGGNARVRDRETGKEATYQGRPAHSDQVYFSKMKGAKVVLDRGQFVRDFQAFFVELDRLFSEETDMPLWPAASRKNLVGDSNDAFSGSSRAMFDSEYDDDYIVNVLKKGRMGDIDIMIPEDRKSLLWDFLDGKDAHDDASAGQGLAWSSGPNSIVYLGQNDGASLSTDRKTGKTIATPRSGPKGAQINCIFAYEQGENPPQFVQVDFEFVPYSEETGMPTDLAVLGHYSAEEDMEVNVKGAFRAKLLQTIVRITTFIEAPVFSTATRVVPRSEAKPGRAVPTASGEGDESSDYVIHKGTSRSSPATGAAEYTFSGDHGVRRRLLQLGPSAFGQKAYRELSTPKESKYVQDLPEIFRIIFSLDPDEEPDPSDLRDLLSFKGLIRLVQKYRRDRAYDILMGLPGQTRGRGLVQELFGPQAQNLYADDDTSDEEYKTAALSIYLDSFPGMLTPELELKIESMKTSYYELQRRKRG